MNDGDAGIKLLAAIVGFWIIMRSVNKDASHRTLANYLTGTSGSANTALPAFTAPATAAQVNAATGAATVAPNASSIIHYLVANGLTPVAAAGVVGNLQQESSLNAATPGGGLAQWIGSRWTALTAFAAKLGLSPSSQQAQLQYLVSDLNGPYRSTLAQLNAAATPAQAAVIFSQQYERPGIPMISNRQIYAQSAFTAAGY